MIFWPLYFSKSSTYKHMQMRNELDHLTLQRRDITFFSKLLRRTMRVENFRGLKIKFQSRLMRFIFIFPPFLPFFSLTHTWSKCNFLQYNYQSMKISVISVLIYKLYLDMLSKSISSTSYKLAIGHISFAQRLRRYRIKWKANCLIQVLNLGRRGSFPTTIAITPWVFPSPLTIDSFLAWKSFGFWWRSTSGDTCQPSLPSCHFLSHENVGCFE